MFKSCISIFIIYLEFDIWVVQYCFKISSKCHFLWKRLLSHCGTQLLYMHYLHRTDKPCMFLGCWSTHAISGEYFGLVSIQRNIVLLCKRRIPLSKRLALFKPLQIIFFIGTFQLCGLSATLAPYWYCHVQMTRDHAQNACDWGLHIKCDTNKKQSRNLNSVPFGPSKYMKTALAITDARYYGHTDTSPGPKLKFSLFFSRFNGHLRHVFKKWCHLNSCIWSQDRAIFSPAWQG